MIIAGHRRYRAFKVLKEKHIPCIVKEKARSNDELTELALIENLQRDDLNAYEIASSIKGLEDKGQKVEDICTITGYQKTQVYKYKKAYELIEKGTIEKEHLLKKGLKEIITENEERNKANKEIPPGGKSKKKTVFKAKKEWFNVVKKQVNKAIKGSSKDELKKAKIAFTEILNNIETALGGDAHK
jgi:ParB family chromosome partitioning protein